MEADKFTCLKCSNSILVENSNTHEIMCKGDPSSENKIFKCQICKRSILSKHKDLHNAMCRPPKKPSKKLSKIYSSQERQELKLIACIQCGQFISVAMVEDHKKDCIERQIIICQQCGLQIPIYLINQHGDVCEGKDNNIKVQYEQWIQHQGQDYEDVDLQQVYQAIGLLAIDYDQQQKLHNPQPFTQAQVDKLKTINIQKEQDCSICYAIMKKKQKIIQLPCQHKFHKICLLGWLTTTPKCPYCRKLARN